MKKVFSLLLVLAMCMSLMPAVHAEEVVASGSCGENLTWVLDSSGLLTISGDGPMGGYGHDAPWYDHADSIRKVVMTDGITSIGDRAFYSCGKMTEVTIPDTVTSIGIYAFNCCFELREVTLPEGLTYLGKGAFGSCFKLGSITIPGGVKHIDWYTFSDCYSMPSVTLSEGLEIIDVYAFHNCSLLTEVTIPASVTKIGNGAFGNCWRMMQYHVAQGNTSYKTIDGVLFDYSGKTLVYYPAGRQGSYTIPDGVTTIGYTSLLGCRYLTTLTIPESVTRIDNYVFSDCNSLTDIYYAGSEAQWNQINIGSIANDDLEKVNIHFAKESPKQVFADVDPGSFYEEPVAWAVDNGITTGTSDTTFSPMNDCTRAQVVTFLWRSCNSPEPESTDTGFTDVPADAYYAKAVAWAVENGITNGMSETVFGSDQACTRAQVATFLWRAANEPAATSADNPFTDAAPGEFYYEAVLWAVGEGITNGTSATTFSPATTCNRAQIVTFLHRYMTE